MTELSTERLLLRQWRDDDLSAFAVVNADPEVMKYFPEPLSRGDSDRLVARLQSGLRQRGWGLWAVEAPGLAPFIGFIGLNPVGFRAHFAPAIEVGWRLDRRYWGHGYATEGAGAALEFAFSSLECEQIVSFTAATNQRSIRVMQRLGMTNDPADDFDHPSIAGGSLRRHVLYRIARTSWISDTVNCGPPGSVRLGLTS